MTNSLNLPEINQEEALALTKFFINSKQNIFLFGRRGTGKTDIAIQSALESKFKINYINLSVIERPDLAGYPDMNIPGDIINFKSPYFLPPLAVGKEPDSILLLDEIDKAPAEITAPLLEILLLRKVNGKPINANSCILTGNLLNESSYSNEISRALLDRGAKYILSFDFEKWLEWAKAHGVHDLIIGFLCHNPTLACGSAEDTAYASPSPRSWTLASQALLKTKEHQIFDSDSIKHIVSGYVGVEAGLRFKIWYDHYRRFDSAIRSLIENGKLSINFDDLSLTEKLVFVISACSYAKVKYLSDKSKNKIVFLENLCEFIVKQNVDLEVQLIGFNAFSFDMVAKHKLYACKVFFDIFNRLYENTTLKK